MTATDFADSSNIRGRVDALRAEHPLIADVVCFHGPHINHLTPRTLDIDAVQRRMPANGIEPKAVIEGPPRRAVPILLRQTRFEALQEPIRFAGDAQGHDTARFGEIEPRGDARKEDLEAALGVPITDELALYDGIQNHAIQKALNAVGHAQAIE